MKSFWESFSGNEEINKQLKIIIEAFYKIKNQVKAIEKNVSTANIEQKETKEQISSLSSIAIKERELENLKKEHYSYWPVPCGEWISCDRALFLGLFTPHRTITREKMSVKKAQINAEKDKLIFYSTQPTQGANYAK